MTALRCDSRRFQTARPTANNHHVTNHASRFLDDMRQAHVLTRRGGILNTQNVQTLVLAINAIVGANTLANLIHLIHFDLGNEMRISNMRSSHTNKIHITCFNDAFRLVRIFDVLRVNHRHIHHFFDACRQVQERLWRITHVGDYIRQGVVCVTTRTHHTKIIHHACGIVILRDLFHIVVVQTVWVKFISRNTHSHHKIWADFFSHCFQNFHAEFHATFKGSAPFVRAFVHSWRPKLVNHMLVNRRQFDTIQTAFFGTTSRLHEIADNAPDFFYFDHLTGRAMHRFTNTRRRH